MRSMNFAAMLATATAVTATATASNAVTVTIDDRIEIISGVSSTRGGSATEVDHWSFTVTNAGQVDIDVLSYNWDKDNDGIARYIDPVIFLFNDDGALDSSDLVTANDDSGFTFSDGSTSSLDSFISTTLAAGDYILAISDYAISTSTAAGTVNTTGYYPAANNGTTMEFNYNGCPVLGCDYGDYRITITGDVALPTPSPVPLPAGLPMGLLGLAGLGALRLTRHN